ncbi:MAG: DNA polymerase III subunit beta [Ferrovum sp.]|nr:DNA polymerase III subunit beta [Ferrovum sp.]
MTTIVIIRENLLGPIQSLLSIVERRQTMPILSNVLLDMENDTLRVQGTDLEIQVKALTSVVEINDPKPFLVSARKLHDIVRSLPEGSRVTMENKDGKLLVRSGKSRFNLHTLEGVDFPCMAPASEPGISITLPQRTLKSLLERVQYAVAQQDVRFYLNGTYLGVDGLHLTAVATDGHRMAFTTHVMETESSKIEAILPRKTVSELIKLLAPNDDPVSLMVYPKQVVFSIGNLEFLTKVIEGKYPDYHRVIPTTHNRHLTVSRLALLHALQRASILSNEKVRGVRFLLTSGNLAIICSNSEQEEAHEDMEVDYHQEPMDVGFNITYLLEVLNHLTVEQVTCSFGETGSSMLLTIPGAEEQFKYVVMPMRI